MRCGLSSRTSMPTYRQIDLLKERRDNLAKEVGEDAPFVKQLDRQISAMKRSEENRKTGEYAPNPVSFVASMQKPKEK